MNGHRGIYIYTPTQLTRVGVIQDTGYIGRRVYRNRVQVDFLANTKKEGEREICVVRYFLLISMPTLFVTGVREKVCVYKYTRDITCAR